MRAAVFTAFGGPDDIAVSEVPDPEPGPTDVLVDVAAAAVNHHDLWLLRGEAGLDADDLPFVSGVDVAGTVAAVGDDVSELTPGDRVVLCPNQTCGSCRQCREGPENRCAEYDLFHGGFAEQFAAPADRLIPIPDGVSFETAAAIPVSYLTAFHMLGQAETAPGDRVFVPGATGGVGVAAIQLAAVLGAESIGTSSSRAKLDRLEAATPVDHVVHAADPDPIATAVEAIGPVDVTINHLGGAFTDLGMSVLRRGGRMVVCGRTAGGTSEIDVRDLYWRHKRVIGSTMGTQPELERLIDLAGRGALEPVIGDEYALEETAQAFRDMQERDAFGKLIVVPGA